MELPRTKAGHYKVIDVTDFAPGKPIPKSWDCSNGPWFFIPSDWEAPHWGGSALAQLTGFPVPYSPSFPTAEEALAAAQWWEDDKERREANWAEDAVFFRKR